jgi:hypothetical protein
VEVFKTMPNGMSVSWPFAPNENGSEIDAYQIELLEYRHGDDLDIMGIPQDFGSNTSLSMRSLGSLSEINSARDHENPPTQSAPDGAVQPMHSAAAQFLLEEGDEESAMAEDSAIKSSRPDELGEGDDGRYSTGVKFFDGNEMVEPPLTGASQTSNIEKDLSGRASSPGGGGGGVTFYDDNQLVEPPETWETRSPPRVDESLYNKDSNGEAAATGDQASAHSSLEDMDSLISGVRRVDVDRRAKPPPDRYHRLIKHKAVKHLYREITGLQQRTMYTCRLRCHNGLGYSDWSRWCTPVQVQNGVSTLGFTASASPPEDPSVVNDDGMSTASLGQGDDLSSVGKLSVEADYEMVGGTVSSVLSWFIPSLNEGRSVTGFEVQQFSVHGPMQKIIRISLPDYIKEREQFSSMIKFETVAEKVTVNTTEVHGLKPGGNYIFR